MSGHGVLRRVEVELGERSYPVEIGADMLGGLGPRIKERTGAGRAILVTVPPVGRRYARRLLRSLREAGLRVGRIDVPDGDRSKNLRQVARLYETLLAQGADRSTVLVALGGGVVGDLAGFAAATFLRGVPFVQVPTTLLAMVDASIGGKTGVNLPEGKNLVGAFYQPRLVAIDATTLRTLPPRELSAGFAEIVKHAAIWDAELFEELERDAEILMKLDREALIPVIERNVRIKAEVVSRDEREAGLRALLNFGHTLAHAVEVLHRYRKFLHGEAVAIGMVYAAVRSEALGQMLECGVHRFRAPHHPNGEQDRAPLVPRDPEEQARQHDRDRRCEMDSRVVLLEDERGDAPPRVAEALRPRLHAEAFGLGIESETVITPPRWPRGYGFG